MCPVIRKPQAFPRSSNRFPLMSHCPALTHMTKPSYRYLASQFPQRAENGCWTCQPTMSANDSSIVAPSSSGKDFQGYLQSKCFQNNVVTHTLSLLPITKIWSFTVFLILTSLLYLCLTWLQPHQHIRLIGKMAQGVQWKCGAFVCKATWLVSDVCCLTWVTKRTENVTVTLCHWKKQSRKWLGSFLSITNW